MATLTGTQIKNTYDSVLKLSDNTPLTNALKTVTDGIGSPTPLSVSAFEISSSVTFQAPGFQIPGGTATQFLTADGSTSTTTPQVQSDWNATSGDAFILNKPTIPSGNQIIDWTVSQGATNIHQDNYVDWTVNQANTTIHQTNFPASVAYNYWRIAEDGVVKGNVLSAQQVSFRSGTHANFTVVNNASTTATHEVKLDVANTQWDDAYTHSQVAHAPSNAEANVQSDWNAVIGDAVILNKPTLTTGTVTGTGTNNYVPLWNGTTSLNDSTISQTGTDIGIGTESPDSKLHIYANNADAPTVLTIENGDTGVIAGQDLSKIEFLTNDSSTPGAGVAASIRTVCQNAGNIFDLAFNTQHGSTRTERMRLDGLGNLGIGTTDPTSKLQVTGLPSHSSNAAAITAGLTTGAFYHTSGTLKVVI